MSSDRRTFAGCFSRSASLALGALVLVGGLLACDAGPGKVLHPTFPDGGLLKTARPLSASSLERLRGLYQVSAGTDSFGGMVAVSSTRDTLSLFAAANTCFAVLRAGCLESGDKLVFEGYWRYANRTDTGLVRLFLDPPAAAQALCAAQEPPSSALPIQLTGAVGDRNAAPDRAVGFSFEESLRVDPNQYTFVIAHRGGCRTSDECGASENSVEVLRMAESLGAQGVEVDVRTTADGVPILYHDEGFSPRLVQGEYCHGSVEDFTFAHLRALCTLEYGENVPTLEEALSTVVRDTTLRGVWLDLKSPSVLLPAVKIAARYAAEAKAAGRAVTFVAGLPDETMVDAWLAQGAASFGIPCLAEESASEVERAGCQVWAPRWTLGPMPEQVAALQAQGKAVAFWTLDEFDFINLFLREAHPNALLTNRPGLVFHRYQLLGSGRPSGVEP